MDKPINITNTIRIQYDFQECYGLRLVDGSGGYLHSVIQLKGFEKNIPVTIKHNYKTLDSNGNVIVRIEVFLNGIPIGFIHKEDVLKYDSLIHTLNSLVDKKRVSYHCELESMDLKSNKAGVRYRTILLKVAKVKK